MEPDLTPWEVDRRCARYGTLAGFGVAVFIVFLFAVTGC